MAVHWMGDEIEALAKALGGDYRQRVATWVWECGCRNRRPRYQRVLKLALNWVAGCKRGDGVATMPDVKAELEAVLAEAKPGA